MGGKVVHKIAGLDELGGDKFSTEWLEWYTAQFKVLRCDKPQPDSPFIDGHEKFVNLDRKEKITDLQPNQPPLEGLAEDRRALQTILSLCPRRAISWNCQGLVDPIDGLVSLQGGLYRVHEPDDDAEDHL